MSKTHNTLKKYNHILIHEGVTIAPPLIHYKIKRHINNKIRKFLDENKYLEWKGESDANPMKLIEVKPCDIEYYHYDQPRKIGKVASGYWDTNRIPFKYHSIYRSFDLRFNQGYDWNETPQFIEHKHKISNGEAPRGCNTLSQLNAHFHNYDLLYEKIKKNGYKTQRELFSEKPKETTRLNNDTSHPFSNEIGVNIYSNGSMGKKSTGTHRLAIAKILDLKKIPVLVRTRHADWQNVRDYLRSNTYSNQKIIHNHIHTHPDLQDLLKNQRK